MAAASRDSTCSSRGTTRPQKHSQWVRTDHKFETNHQTLLCWWRWLCIMAGETGGDTLSSSSRGPARGATVSSSHGKQGYSMTDTTSTQCTQSCSAQKQVLGSGTQTPMVFGEEDKALFSKDGQRVHSENKASQWAELYTRYTITCRNPLFPRWLKFQAISTEW